MLGHVRTCSDMHGHARTCTDMHGHARASLEHAPGHVRAQDAMINKWRSIGSTELLLKAAMTVVNADSKAVAAATAEDIPETLPGELTDAYFALVRERNTREMYQNLKSKTYEKDSAQSIWRKVKPPMLPLTSYLLPSTSHLLYVAAAISYACVSAPVPSRPHSSAHVSDAQRHVRTGADTGMLGHARTCTDMHRHVRTCSDMCGHARTCSDMLGHARTCTDMHGHARASLSLPCWPCPGGPCLRPPDPPCSFDSRCASFSTCATWMATHACWSTAWMRSSAIWRI